IGIAGLAERCVGDRSISFRIQHKRRLAVLTECERDRKVTCWAKATDRSLRYVELAERIVSAVAHIERIALNRECVGHAPQSAKFSPANRDRLRHSRIRDIDDRDRIAHGISNKGLPAANDYGSRVYPNVEMACSSSLSVDEAYGAGGRRAALIDGYP